MTREELLTKLYTFRVNFLNELENMSAKVLQEFDEKEAKSKTTSPAEKARIERENWEDFALSTGSEDCKWMFHEGVRQFRFKMESELKATAILTLGKLDQMEKELLA